MPQYFFINGRQYTAQELSKLTKEEKSPRKSKSKDKKPVAIHQDIVPQISKSSLTKDIELKFANANMKVTDTVTSFLLDENVSIEELQEFLGNDENFIFAENKEVEEEVPNETK
jgi:hypothetical protein